MGWEIRFVQEFLTSVACLLALNNVALMMARSDGREASQENHLPLQRGIPTARRRITAIRYDTSDRGQSPRHQSPRHQTLACSTCSSAEGTSGSPRCRFHRNVSRSHHPPCCPPIGPPGSTGENFPGSRFRQEGAAVRVNIRTRQAMPKEAWGRRWGRELRYRPLHCISSTSLRSNHQCCLCASRC